MNVAADLEQLGLAAGARVVVHSSLRQIGAGAAEAVAALVDVVGPRGLLVVPTFTYTTDRFDPATTPGRSGALAEELRRRPGAVRSLHPTHSVAAFGDGAAELCEGHETHAATDVDTPLDRLAAGGGYVLLLGVGHVADTTAHVGEFHAEAPYLEIPFSPDWPREHEIVVGREVMRVAYDRFPGCSRAFGALERGLRASGAIRDGRVGRAQAQLVDGSAVVDETVALLRGDASALLCTDPRCYRCTRARELLA
jgi:aminoglycoside 3-N-acetyltransferase